MSEKVLVYTLHKAGSLFLHRLNEAVAERLGVALYSINNESQFDMIASGSWTRLIEDPDLSPACFGPIRSQEAEPNIPRALDGCETLLHVRDPRDTLVSLYFYHVFSRPNEPVPQTHGREQIEKWKAMGIDAVTLEWAEHQREKYRAMTDRLMGLGSVKVVRYEDMVERFGEWLDAYLESFQGLLKASGSGLSMDALREEMYLRFKDEFQPPQAEDVFAHKRQITPGDHRRKLKAETVERLDETFADVLDALGYVRSAALEEGRR